MGLHRLEDEFRLVNFNSSVRFRTALYAERLQRTSKGPYLCHVPNHT